MLDTILHDSSAWLMLSFFIFAFIVWKMGKAAFVAGLDKYISNIRNEIQTAENLRVEAQELLAQYQRKHRDAVDEAADIVESANRRANEILKNAEAELKEMTERREKSLAERVQRLENDAMERVKAYAAELAINATREIIAEKLDKKANQNLVDDSIKAVSGNIR